MILHKTHLPVLSKKEIVSFVIANFALEGQKLSRTDLKNISNILSGKESADDIVERILLREGLHRSVASI